LADTIIVQAAAATLSLSLLSLQRSHDGAVVGLAHGDVEVRHLKGRPLVDRSQCGGEVEALLRRHDGADGRVGCRGEDDDGPVRGVELREHCDIVTKDDFIVAFEKPQQRSV
jgi:hypothetical protein